ncbi:MAG: cyclic nucleotide-binding domain-containing protein, partial [Candidatus Sericytochromatia bacterium]
WNWLEFKPDGSHGRSLQFWPPEDKLWQSAPAPDWACQIHNGEYLLQGDTCLLLLAPRQEALRWIHKLPDPKREDALLKVAFKSHSDEETRKQKAAEILTALKAAGTFEAEKEEQVEYLAKHLQLSKNLAGNWLLQPGTPGNALYIVLEGSIEIIAPEPEKPVIYTAGPGDICAQQGVLSMEEKPYKPGLRVKEDAKLLILDKTEFKKAVVGFPRLYQLIRSQDGDNQRRFKAFAERKTEAVQDQLRLSINETRIREFGLFADADHLFFEALAEKVQPLAYMPEQDVFARLESGGSLFLILEGQVGVLRKGESEPLILLGEGEIFGEMALYFNQPRSATIRTMDYCKFFEIEYRHVRTLSARFPWFGLRLEEMARQRQQGNQINEAAYEEASGLKRDDLPSLEVAPAGLKGRQIYYHASLHHDALLGFNTQGELLWFWGREADKQLFQPTRVHSLGGSLLVVDTGNDRVLEVDTHTREILRKWSGSLSRPRAAALTPEGLLLVADEGNQRLVAMDESGREVWTHGLPEEIMKPTWVEFTPDGNILFADAGMHRVYELQRDGVLVWKHGKWRNAGTAVDQLDSPSCVRRMIDGSTLIADAGNRRLVWIRPEADPVLISLDSINLEPEYCELLENGEFLVSSASENRIVRLNRRGEVTWKALISFPQAGHQAQPEQTAPAQEGERWILDLDQLEQLEAQQPQPAAELASDETAVEEPAAVDLVMAWGEGASPAQEQPEPEPDSQLMPELDAVLEDLHQELSPDETQGTHGTSWSELAFLEHPEMARSETINLPGNVRPTNQHTPTPEAQWGELDFLDQPVPENLDLAMDMLFDDVDAEAADRAEAASTGSGPAAGPAPEDLGVAMDQLFDDVDAEAVDHQVAAPAGAGPAEEPAPEDLGMAMDQLFDDVDAEAVQAEALQAEAAPEDLVMALDMLFDDEPGADEVTPAAVGEASAWEGMAFLDAETPPASAEPGQASTDFDEALDQLFDDVAADTGKAAPRTPAPEQVRPQQPVSVNPHPPLPAGMDRPMPTQMVPKQPLPAGMDRPMPTQMVPKQPLPAGMDRPMPTQMVPKQPLPAVPASDQPMPTQMLPNQPMHTKLVPNQPMLTRPAPQLPWAELGLEPDEPVPADPEAVKTQGSSTQQDLNSAMGLLFGDEKPDPALAGTSAASGWSDADFDFLDSLDD